MIDLFNNVFIMVLLYRFVCPSSFLIFTNVNFSQFFFSFATDNFSTGYVCNIQSRRTQYWPSSWVIESLNLIRASVSPGVYSPGLILRVSLWCSLEKIFSYLFTLCIWRECYVCHGPILPQVTINDASFRGR